MSVIGTPMSGLSGYQQMQVWSAKRQAANQDYQSNMASLSSSLTGSTGPASTGSFVSNDTLSSALFGSVSDNLSGEETLVAQIVKTRLAREQQEKAAKQLAQIDAAGSLLDSLR